MATNIGLPFLIKTHTLLDKMMLEIGLEWSKADNKWVEIKCMGSKVL